MSSVRLPLRQPLKLTPPLGKSITTFANDQELMKYALVTLQQAADPEDIICSDAVTLDRTSLKNSSGKSPRPPPLARSLFLVNHAIATT